MGAMFVLTPVHYGHFLLLSFLGGWWGFVGRGWAYDSFGVIVNLNRLLIYCVIH